LAQSAAPTVWSRELVGSRRLAEIRHHTDVGRHVTADGPWPSYQITFSSLPGRPGRKAFSRVGMPGGQRHPHTGRDSNHLPRCPAPLRQWPQIASQHRPTCDPKRSPLANSISAMPGGAAKSATTATGAWSTSPAGAPLRWQFRRLAWAKMRQVRMNVVPASDFGHGYQQPGSPQQSAASPPRSNPAAASDLARQSLSLMCPVTCK
jgi:hypothetical protein